jgi:hypothetical protein
VNNGLSKTPSESPKAKVTITHLVLTRKDRKAMLKTVTEAYLSGRTHLDLMDLMEWRDAMNMYPRHRKAWLREQRSLDS